MSTRLAENQKRSHCSINLPCDTACHIWKYNCLLWYGPYLFGDSSPLMLLLPSSTELYNPSLPPSRLLHPPGHCPVPVHLGSASSSSQGSHRRSLAHVDAPHVHGAAAGRPRAHSQMGMSVPGTQHYSSVTGAQPQACGSCAGGEASRGRAAE